MQNNHSEKTVGAAVLHMRGLPCLRRCAREVMSAVFRKSCSLPPLQPPLPRPHAARLPCAAAICGVRWKAAAADRVDVVERCKRSGIYSILTRGLFSAIESILIDLLSFFLKL